MSMIWSFLFCAFLFCFCPCIGAGICFLAAKWWARIRSGKKPEMIWPRPVYKMPKLGKR